MARQRENDERSWRAAPSGAAGGIGGYTAPMFMEVEREDIAPFLDLVA